MPKELFLRLIAGSPLTRYSDQPNLARRAGQLQRFLGELQKTLDKNISSDQHTLEFWVLSRKDWSRLTSRPYGLAFVRQQVLIAPADYNPRMTESFDDVLLQAAQHKLKAPGEVRELFDLLIAYEWAKGKLKGLGLNARQREQNGFVAAYLFLLVLQDFESLQYKITQWARILALIELKGSFKDLPLIGQSILEVKEPSWRGLQDWKQTKLKKLIASLD